MSSDRVRVVLDQAVELIIDNRGRPTPPLAEHGVPFVSAKNVYDGRLHLDVGQRFISREKADEWSRHQVRVGDILLTSEAPLGEAAYLTPSADLCIGQRLFGLRARCDVVDGRFLYYTLCSPQVQARIHARASGTTAQGIKQSELRQIELDVPALPEQRRIASILGALDDKIDSNRRLAGLLEETVAALFRAQFVDFVGVEEFEESEIGRVPRGLRMGSVYELAEVTYGRPFKSNLFNSAEGTPLIRIRDLPSNDPSVLTPELRDDARLIRRNDIVVGMDGEFRAYSWAGPEAWLNQRVCVFDPRDGTSRVFLLEAIKRPLAFFEATKGGTTVIHLGKRDIDTFRVILPPSDVMRDFGAAADPLLTYAVELRWESRILAAIRDALLPKLVSGAIRVSNTTDPAEVIEPVAEALSVAS